MAKNDENKIVPETPHLILCEGLDAKLFILWFLDFHKRQDSAFAAFRAYDFGGITDLTPFLRTISKTEGFRIIVRSICILRDAETAASDACRSIQASLRTCGFSVPDRPCVKADGSVNYPQIATGFALFPDICGILESGTLEDLCLRILGKDDAEEILTCADAALAPRKEHLSRFHKNRLHTYFSLTDEFVSLKIGQAAQANAFNYESSDIIPLKSFLLQMAGQ
jgi:hypothetical protein